jgi:hypothetical protein
LTQNLFDPSCPLSSHPPLSVSSVSSVVFLPSCLCCLFVSS